MSESTGRQYSSNALLLVQARNMIEALGNLNHLTIADAGDINAVRSYARQADEILNRLAELLRLLTRDVE